jgi:ABC-type nitrate/sulfonate/bicarbonate transport system substrate-binding protein
MRLLISLCFLLLVGCEQATQPRLRILLDWWPNPVHVPLYVGMKGGFFVEEGLEIEVISTPEPPQALLFLLSGRADIVIHSAPNTLQALGRCPHLRLLGTLIDQPLRALMFLDDSPIREAHDLHDKILGGNPEGLLTAYVRSIMNSHGVQFREVRKLSWDSPTALLTGAVDVIAGVYWNIEPAQLNSVGIKTRCFSIEEFGVPAYDELVFLTTKELIEDRPHLSMKFRRALQNCLNWCREHPQEAFEIYASQLPNKSSRTLEWERSAWKATFPLLAFSQQPNKEKWKNLASWMDAHQLSKHCIDLNRFLEEFN